LARGAQQRPHAREFDVDFAVGRKFSIREHLKLQLRAGSVQHPESYEFLDTQYDALSGGRLEDQ